MHENDRRAISLRDIVKFGPVDLELAQRPIRRRRFDCDFRAGVGRERDQDHDAGQVVHMRLLLNLIRSRCIR